MNSTSVSLLRRLKQPEQEQAWRRFVELYTPLLYHWVRKSGVNGSHTADVVQEVFAVLVEKLPDFDYDASGSFRAWLRTVTQNKCRDRLRKIVASKTVDVTLDVVEPSQVDDIELFSEAEYRRALAHRALELMQTEFESTTWKACWESVVSERSVTEISKELGITPNAVYLSKSRVLRRLREELDGLLD